MQRYRARVWIASWAAWAAVAGCAAPKATAPSDELETYRCLATQIETPDVHAPVRADVIATLAPRALDEQAPREYRDLGLDEAVRMALSTSDVLRDLGGVMLQSPGNVRTAHLPATAETDPRFGVEAALSEFDALFTSSAYFEKNDRALNNQFLGGGTRLFNQDYILFQNELTKRSAAGTQYIFRHHTDYDANNAQGNQFPSAWNVWLDAEVRQPLLQGAGTEFNRIAGPGGTPGAMNGVLLARLRTDLSLADFEIGVRNLVSNVENAYWDLYFAYRDLDAKIQARDAALQTWRTIYANFQANREGGEADKEALAREQYYLFQEEVENALTGRLQEGTRTNNGTSGGVFRGNPGVYVAERRLRLLLNLPQNDGVLLRPAQEPQMAKVVFDWMQIADEAVSRRVELRRQRFEVKRAELELVGSRNFLLPTLDAVARYRWRGFGHDLLDTNNQGNERFDNAWQDLTNGDFQEWQLGAELTIPLGQRRAHAAVRNAELRLIRERSVLREQEREVVHDLSNAVADVDRAYTVAQTAYNRRLASKQLLSAAQAAYEANKVPLDLVIDAQRRVADSDSRYHRALVEYALAIKNVHFEKGSLLEFNDVRLAEGGWPCEAYADAQRRRVVRCAEGPLDYCLAHPPQVSRGGLPQQPQTVPVAFDEPPPSAAPSESQPTSRTAPGPAPAPGPALSIPAPEIPPVPRAPREPASPPKGKEPPRLPEGTGKLPAAPLPPPRFALPSDLAPPKSRAASAAAPALAPAQTASYLVPGDSVRGLQPQGMGGVPPAARMGAMELLPPIAEEEFAPPARLAPPRVSPQPFPTPSTLMFRRESQPAERLPAIQP